MVLRVRLFGLMLKEWIRDMVILRLGILCLWDSVFRMKFMVWMFGLILWGSFYLLLVDGVFGSVDCRVVKVLLDLFCLNNVLSKFVIIFLFMIFELVYILF